MNISDERLKDLIAHARAQHNMIGIGITGDTLTALRELRDYRKAVGAYVEAYDANINKPCEATAEQYFAALATLRALQESDDE